MQRCTAAGATFSLGTNMLAVPPQAGQYQPSSASWLAHSSRQPALPQTAFLVFKAEMPNGFFTYGEEYTWLNICCNLGALQSGNSQAACSNRHFQLYVLTQDAKGVASGPRWHPYSALSSLRARHSASNESVQPFVNLSFLTTSCWKVAISTSLCSTWG